MALKDTREWLETVCGPAGEAAPDLSAATDAFRLKDAFLTGAMGADFDKAKGAIRASMSGVMLTATTKKRRLRKDKVEARAILAETKEGEATELGVEQTEWDAWDMVAGGMSHITKDGKTHEIDSPEGQEIIEEMKAQLAPLMALSKEMASRMIPGTDKRLFSDRDIEKELWSPLVREGIIPSNLVPKEFSETVNVFRNGAAVYTQMMADEDGTDMGPKKGFDKFLSVSKDVVKWGKTIANESLRYDIFDPDGINWGAGSILEASREDLADFIAHNQTVDLEGMSDEDSAAIEAVLGQPNDDGTYPEDTPSQRTYADYVASNPDDDTSYADYLSAEETRLNEAISDLPAGDPQRIELEADLADIESSKTVNLGTLTYESWESSDSNLPYDEWLDEEQKELEAIKPGDPGYDEAQERLESIKAAQITQSYGEHLQRQAAVNCASALATTALTTAQNARNRKRATRDTVEELLEGLGEAAFQGWSASHDGEARTMDGDTKEAHFKAKYMLLATKAGARAVTKLSHAMVPGERISRDEKKAMFVSAIAELADVAGESVAATGEAGSGDAETRAQRGTAGLAGKALQSAIEAAWVAYETKGDKAALGQLLMTVAAGTAFTAAAGDLGDVTRADKDRDEIQAGADDPMANRLENWDEVEMSANLGVEYGLDGSLSLSFNIDSDWSAVDTDTPFFRNPFEEVEGAAGQADFGMRGDLATLADQREIISEARGLVQEIGEDSYKAQKGMVKKKFDRIRKMAKGNPKLMEDLCSDKAINDWLTLDDAAVPDKEAMDAALRKIMKVLNNTPLDKTLPEKEDKVIVGALAVDDATKAEMNADLDSLRAELAKMDKSSDEKADDAKIFTTFEKLRDNMLKDPRVKADIEKGVAEDAAWIEKMREQADLTRLDAFAEDSKLREAERQKALTAIQTMTTELKKTEAKINMLDKATKGAIGIALAVAPGAALLGKIRDLVADMARAVRRHMQLKQWQRQMEAIRGNYSPYEYAVTGEAEVLRAARAHDIAQAAADVAAVAAETMRLADQTHIGAAALTSIEKIGKCLNDQWYKVYSANRIREGWTTFKAARAEPENRILAREAIRLNTTLGKCVLAYGACIDKDAQAQSAVAACGLTPEVMEDGGDVCQGVVAYLRAQIMDTDVEIVAAHDGDANWLPCPLEPTLANWTMIKSAACRLDPPLAPRFFKTPEIDSQMKALAAATTDQATYDIATELGKRLENFRPMALSGRPHVEMTIAAQDMVPAVRQIRKTAADALRKAAAD